MFAPVRCSGSLSLRLCKAIPNQLNYFPIGTRNFSKLLSEQQRKSTLQVTSAVKKLGSVNRYLDAICKPATVNSVRFNSSSVKKAMEQHSVVPDVINIVPEERVEVKYPSGVEVSLGNCLTPTQVKDEPKVSWDAQSESYYTVCMTDPDAPSREKPEYREWLHWLVGNVPGSNIAAGDVLAAYVGSGPPQGTGLHRYCFVVYKQKGKVDFQEKCLPNTSADGRAKFKISDFAKKYDFGDPVAGNFYRAEWDDYVPLLYKQLGA